MEKFGELEVKGFRVVRDEEFGITCESRYQEPPTNGFLCFCFFAAFATHCTSRCHKIQALGICRQVTGCPGLFLVPFLVPFRLGSHP